MKTNILQGRLQVELKTIKESVINKPFGSTVYQACICSVICLIELSEIENTHTHTYTICTKHPPCVSSGWSWSPPHVESPGSGPHPWWGCYGEKKHWCYVRENTWTDGHLPTFHLSTVSTEGIVHVCVCVCVHKSIGNVNTTYWEFSMDQTHFHNLTPTQLMQHTHTHTSPPALATREQPFWVCVHTACT